MDFEIKPDTSAEFLRIRPPRCDHNDRNRGDKLVPEPTERMLACGLNLVNVTIEPNLGT